MNARTLEGTPLAVRLAALLAAAAAVFAMAALAAPSAAYADYTEGQDCPDCDGGVLYVVSASYFDHFVACPNCPFTAWEGHWGVDFDSSCYCDGCRKRFHVFESTVATKDATCAERGVGFEYFYCDRCNKYYATSDPATPVDVGSWVVPPNGQHTPGEPVRENEGADGYDEVVYCTACGAELSRTHVDAEDSGGPAATTPSAARAAATQASATSGAGRSATPGTGDGLPAAPLAAVGALALAALAGCALRRKEE